MTDPNRRMPEADQPAGNYEHGHPGLPPREQDDQPQEQETEDEGEGR